MIKIQKFIYIALALVLIYGCSKKNNDANFVLNGNVKGLKKGTLYLQRDGKRSLITIDSVIVDGNSNFTMSANIKEPIIMYLRLHKKDGKEHYIPFFANKGVTEVNTTLKAFTNAKIKGSKQQELLNDYLKIMSDFNNQNLELIKAKLEATKQSDSLVLDSILKRSNRLLKLKYASTINFALNNNNSEIAPYLALYEIPDANIKFLDSIYNKLTPEIKESLYGKRLGKALIDVKTTSNR